jgi:hypothetical protein
VYGLKRCDGNHSLFDGGEFAEWRMIAPHLPKPCLDCGRDRADGWQGYHRLRTRLPLRRIRHAARASGRSCFMTFETDSRRLAAASKESLRDTNAIVCGYLTAHWRGTRGQAKPSFKALKTCDERRPRTSFPDRRRLPARCRRRPRRRSPPSQRAAVPDYCCCSPIPPISAATARGADPLRGRRSDRAKPRAGRQKRATAVSARQ